jgi:hypothetical protein
MEKQVRSGKDMRVYFNNDAEALAQRPAVDTEGALDSPQARDKWNTQGRTNERWEFLIG